MLGWEIQGKGVLMAEENFYYGIDGERYGPVSREQLLTLIEAGRLKVGDYLWSESNDEWVPLADREDLAPALLSAAQHAERSAPASGRPYAGFLLRLSAHLVDVFFLILPSMIWSMVVMGIVDFDPNSVDPVSLGEAPLSPENRATTMELLRWQAWFYGGLLLIEWLYRAGLESSTLQATLGKRVFGLVVVDTDGERISFGRASLRHFCKLLSIMSLGLGFLLVLMHERRQALHDQLAGTFVLRS